jgi:single-strand DNA-binding protein
MARFLNQVTITAIVSTDIALKTVKDDKKVAEFSVGIPTEKDGETTWENFAIEAWGAQAQACADYLTKGSKVLISGELKQDRWTKDDKPQSRVYIRAGYIEFLTRKGKEEEAAEG